MEEFYADHIRHTKTYNVIIRATRLHDHIRYRENQPNENINKRRDLCLYKIALNDSLALHEKK